MTVRALFFDVFGTVVDWRTGVLTALEQVGVRNDVVADDWRRAYRPALDRVRSDGTWRDLDTVQRGTLDDVLARYDVDLPPGARETLVQAWRRLPPWPDSAGGLLRLRGRFRTATLSNGHVALLVDLLRYGDLRFDAVLSAELAGSYKPDPAVYRRGAELLGCRPEEAGMVAAHPDDLVAAAEAGFRPLFVRRPLEWGPGTGVRPPEGLPGLVVADDLEHLAELLGC